MKTFIALSGSVALLLLPLIATPALAQETRRQSPPPIRTSPAPSPPDAGSVPVPASSPGSWVTPDDYPLQALIDEIDGRTGFRLNVGTDGRATGCTITESSGSAELDERTCETLLRRARFRPAIDASGRPVAGSYTNAVRWVMPPRELVPEAVHVEVTYVIDESGEISDCQIIHEDIPEGAPPVECLDGMDFQPLRDADGTPVRRRVRQRLQVVYEPVD